MEQVGIAIFGLLAIWLAQDPSKVRRKWASIFGLLGQPFWFWTAVVNEQWGIFILSVLYSIAWLRGLINYWSA